MREPLYKADPDCKACRGKGTVVYNTESGREYDDCDCLEPIEEEQTND